MRTPFQPYGGVSPIIDKMIGNAYDIVKYVARYLKEIRYVAENMEKVYEVAQGIEDGIFDGGGSGDGGSGGGGTAPSTIILKKSANGSTYVDFQLPSDMSYSNIQNVVVTAVGGMNQMGNRLNFASADNFSYYVQDNYIIINIVNYDLTQAYFYCHITPMPLNE